MKHSSLLLSLLILMAAFCSCRSIEIAHLGKDHEMVFRVNIDPQSSLDKTARFASTEMVRYLTEQKIVTWPVEMGDGKERGGNIFSLEVNPALVEKALGKKTPESFVIKTDVKSEVDIVGADAAGLLWGVRDFIHYYAPMHLQGLKNHTPKPLSITTAPALPIRAWWTWWHGVHDTYAYVDAASEWKINTICFWNQGIPLDAERLVDYCHERGIKVWWGFGWGWTEGDFRDASPDLYNRLMALHEKQKARIGAKPASLCPSDPETPAAFKEFVLDVFERHYNWLPKLDGIYFQTATEAVCPCEECKKKTLGETLFPVILPIIEEVHRRRPEMVISWGVHNRDNINEFEDLRQLPPYVNICWEEGLNWAKNLDIARKQMTYRGAEENYCGLYRVVMNCGLMIRAFEIRSDPPHQWLGRLEKNWEYLEEGEPQGSADGFRAMMLGSQEIANPCTSDWRPAPGKRLLDNPNAAQYLEWARALADGPPKTKGAYQLFEASFLELKMRRVPGILAEIAWDPNADEKELEARCQAIWSKQIGGWKESPNPYWKNDNIKVEYDPKIPRKLFVKETGE